MKTNPGFKTKTALFVALANSGGGFRTLLTGVVLVKAFDGRDGSNGTNRLYQDPTYHSGLSSGSWLLSSFTANDQPTILSLQDTPWVCKLKRSLFFPGLNARIQ